MIDNMNYSEYQIAIIDAYRNFSFNIIINARAGSGKTTTLMILADYVKGKKSVFIAFNKHIADELDRRLKAKKSKMAGKTIHSLGFAICVKHIKMDMNNNKYFKLVRDWVWRHPKLYVTDEEIDLAKTGLKKLVDMCRLNLTDLKSPSAIEDVALNYGYFYDDEIIAAVPEIISEGAQIDFIKENGIDFTDMIYLPFFHNWTFNKYDEIFGDEIQDWNNLQLEFVSRSLGANGRVVLVGDPDQSIMGFAGANTDAFDIIRNRFGCHEFPLNYCYRCGSAIVKLANQLVPAIQSPEGQHEGEVHQITKNKMYNIIQAGDVILSRKTAPLVSMCLQFIADGKLARVRGRNIGENIVMHAKKAAILGDWEDFPNSLRDYRSSEIARLIRLGKDEAWIDNMNDICACLEVMWKPEFRNVTEFTGHIMSLFDDENVGITLSTAHKAKGLEWDHVFVINPKEFPLRYADQTHEQLKQEYNLKYVVLTRPKNKLYFVA